MTPYRAIDLFAGIGGIRKGFEQTGKFKTVFANDFDPYCKMTYDQNFETTKLTLKDVRDLSVVGDEIPEFNVLLAGFPCQPFSVGGFRQGLADEKGRGKMFFEIVRLIKEAREAYGQMPQCLLLENVKALQTHDHGRTYQAMLKTLMELGYIVEARVYNSLDFGVAQHRERLYFVGFRELDDYLRFRWPEPTKPMRAPQVAEILEKEVDEKYYYRNRPIYNKIRAELTDPGLIYSYRRNYLRSTPGGWAPTLVASMGTGGYNVPLIHDQNDIRQLTPLECARLQGYDDLKFPNALIDGHRYKQIGNSVTVPVIRVLAQAIAEALR